MKLYIAEKPSLARAIVDLLPEPHRKANKPDQSPLSNTFSVAGTTMHKGV